MLTQLGKTGLLFDDDRGIVAFEANGRQYHAENPEKKRVIGYEVDGVVITEGLRCDYAFAVLGSRWLYLIELKGKDLKTACEQLLATIAVFETRVAAGQIHCRIVLSRIQRPDLRSTQIVRLERKVARCGGTLVRECRRMVERI